MMDTNSYEIYHTKKWATWKVRNEDGEKIKLKIPNTSINIDDNVQIWFLTAPNEFVENIQNQKIHLNFQGEIPLLINNKQFTTSYISNSNSLQILNYNSEKNVWHSKNLQTSGILSIRRAT